MKKLYYFLPTHFTVSLIFGIVIQYIFVFWQLTIVETIVFFIGFLLCLAILKYKRCSLCFTLFSWVFFVSIGMFTVYIQNATNYTNHYSNYLDKNEFVVFVVDKKIKSSLYHDKYFGEVTSVGDAETRGRVLLNIQRDSTLNPLYVNDRIIFQQQFEDISKPLNPHQFNYKKYLKRQGVLHQLFLSNGKYLQVQQQGTSIFKWADVVRKTVMSRLSTYQFQQEELAVINALLLGQRIDISKELITNYTRAGAIHILAVSGLHIGIILMILTFLLKPLERFRRGKFIKTILIVFLLWSFAIIAGLSASVVRAVTMFTAIAIGMSLKRGSWLPQSLIISMFVLLLYSPLLLFDVGFQLSYMAVFSIVWIQPKLYTLLHIKWKFIDNIWKLLTVSTAAQLGVLPISLFYFHQFPGLFLVSNIVIVPFIGGILALGLLIVFLALATILPPVLAQLYGAIISAMNKFVSVVAEQDKFLIEEISFSSLLLIASYLLIFTSVILLGRKKHSTIRLFLVAVIVFQFVLVYQKFQLYNKSALVIFHKNRHTMIAERKGDVLHVFSEISKEQLSKETIIKSYSIGEGIESITSSNEIPSVLLYNNSYLLIIDSLGVYQLEGIRNPTIVLTQSPDLNLERLITMIAPKEIIADGSNYKSKVAYWSAVCNKRKIPFYTTRKEGARIFE